MSATTDSTRVEHSKISTQAKARSATQVAVSAGHLYHAFPGRDGAPVLAVNDVSFEIPYGQFVSIIGPSGCGKTTVLNLISGLERQQSGTLSVLGKPPRSGRPEIAMAFARDALLPWRDATDNVALSLEMQGVERTSAVRGPPTCSRWSGLATTSVPTGVSCRRACVSAWRWPGPS